MITVVGNSLPIDQQIMPKSQASRTPANSELRDFELARREPALQFPR